MSEDPSYSLLRAVRDGNVETVLQLIETYGLSYSKSWSCGYNLLRDALQHEREEVTKLLLSKGSKVNSKRKRPSETPLHLAVKNGWTEIVEMLLEREASVSAKDHSSETPLHCAVERGSQAIVRLLLDRSAIDARSKHGMTALHRAVQTGNLAIAEDLLSHGAQVNAVCTQSYKNGYTPLHCAAAQGNEAMVSLLLVKGADINASTRDRVTPLHVATDMHRDKVVRLLLEKGANVDSRDNNGVSVLHFAVEKVHLIAVEHILHFRPDVTSEANRSSLYVAIKSPACEKSRKIVEALLRYGFTVRPEDARDSRLLHSAVERGYREIVETLLKLGADVNALHGTKKGATLLHSATLCRQLEIAKLLLSYGANVNAKDDMRKSPVCYAIENNDAGMTKLLLTSSADVEVTTELLHTAVRKESCEIVEILLELASNIDVNACDKLGRTALHHTALNEGWDFSPMVFFPVKKGITGEELPDARAEMARTFLNHGARVNAKTKNGATALHLAVEGDYSKVIKVLLDNKADVNALAEHRTTPLHSAVKRDNRAVVKMLLDCGANVNARQKNGTSALHTASKSGHEQVVKLLAERGAELDARDKEKSTPIHLAASNNYSEIVENLLKFGASIEAKDKLRRTALHLAAKHGWSTVVEVLLNHGADVNVTCRDSMSPLDYAILGTTEFNNRHDDRLFSTRFSRGDLYDYFDDDYDSVSDCPCEEVAEILEQHIVSIKALGLYVSEKNLKAIDLQYEHRETLEDCQMEIESMRKKKIGDSNVSFYDVLTRGMNQLAVYARNKSIVKVLEAEEYHCNFPSYSPMILRRFKQGQKRESLLSNSLKALGALCGFVLPDLSANELFNYLSNRDLENLIRADSGAELCDS